MVSILDCPQLAAYLSPHGTAALAPGFIYGDENCFLMSIIEKWGGLGKEQVPEHRMGILHPSRAGRSKAFPSGAGNWVLGAQ